VQHGVVQARNGALRGVALVELDEGVVVHAAARAVQRLVNVANAPEAAKGFF